MSTPTCPGAGSSETGRPPRAGRPSGGGRPGGSRRNRARDYTVITWLLDATIVTVAHRLVPESTWLTVHLVPLGAPTHSMLVWSQYLTAALLKTRPDEARDRAQRRRLGLLSLGSLTVLVGVPATWWWLVVAGAVFVTAAVSWHGTSLWRQLHKALPGRFRVVAWYYVAASCHLPVGAGFGATLAFGPDVTWHRRFLAAHTMTSLLGWIGLTVVGALVTFWPAILRTRMDDCAEGLARQALPWLIGSGMVVVAGALTGLQYVAVAGLAGYLLALGWWGRVFVAPLRRRPPRKFAPAPVLAVMIWWVVTLVVTGGTMLTTPTSGWSEVTGTLAVVWASGFAAQLLTGALSYLLPPVLGGGPRVVRAGAAWFDRFTTFRIVALNGALILFLTPTPPWVKLTSGVLGVGPVAAFLPLMILGVKASVAECKAIAKAGPRTGPPQKLPRRESALTANGMLAGVLVLTLAVTAGVDTDPSEVGLGGGPPSTGVNATDRTQRIQVTAKEGLRFGPASAEVSHDDRVIIELSNADTTMIHDLKLGDAITPRLSAGETAELGLGVVRGSIKGWCTVVGHRQAGMVFILKVSGQDVSTSQDGTTGGGHDHAPAQANSAPLNTVVDPVAPAAVEETIHRMEMRVMELPLEVAPRVWQKRRTFNGGPVGPTLRGKVGDVLEVTLINDGTIGRSIDFHASNLTLDGPMRTIAPDESPVYRFTAHRAGMWPYHCGTASVSAHITAGMHGVMIIDPEGLPAVDREYALMASETYLTGGTGTSPETAAEVDAAKAQTDTPDYSTFNGIAFQYAQRPFTAKVEERVRFWVLSAGPNLSTSFHVIGDQFDIVYFGDGYLLRDGKDAFGSSGGGSQALGLEATRAGFVELTSPEAGHYTVVDHAFLDAERGALGTVEVTE